jgi:hypothetical protein
MGDRDMSVLFEVLRRQKERRQDKEKTMTLEERLERLEAHLGIGDSAGAIATRKESKRQSNMMQALMNPFVPSSKAFLEGLRQK